MVTRWSEKGPGLKILWIWTFATAGIMIASVVRTGLNDMERIMKEQEGGAAASSASARTGNESGGSDDVYLNKDEILRED